MPTAGVLLDSALYSHKYGTKTHSMNYFTDVMIPSCCGDADISCSRPVRIGQTSPCISSGMIKFDSCSRLANDLREVWGYNTEAGGEARLR